MYKQLVLLPLPRYMEKCCVKIEWCCHCHGIWKMSLWKVKGAAAATVWKVFSAVAGNGYKGCPQKQLLRRTQQKGSPATRARFHLSVHTASGLCPLNWMQQHRATSELHLKLNFDGESAVSVQPRYSICAYKSFVISASPKFNGITHHNKIF